MENQFEISENSVLTVTENGFQETPKKVWSKPVFEVMSMNIIKGGSGSSAESNTAQS